MILFSTHKEEDNQMIKVGLFIVKKDKLLKKIFSVQLLTDNLEKYFIISNTDLL